MDLTGALPRDPQLTYCDEPHPDDPDVQCLREQEVGTLHKGLHCVPGTQIFWGQPTLLSKEERGKVKGAVMEGIDNDPATPPPTSAEAIPPPPIVRRDDPANSHIAAEQIEPSRGTKRAQVLAYLRERYGQWVDAPELATQDVGGFAGTRRMRELRKMGWNIETRQHPEITNLWQHRLVDGVSDEVQAEAPPEEPEPVASLRDFG